MGNNIVKPVGGSSNAAYLNEEISTIPRTEEQRALLNDLDEDPLKENRGTTIKRDDLIRILKPKLELRDMFIETGRSVSSQLAFSKEVLYIYLLLGNKILISNAYMQLGYAYEMNKQFQKAYETYSKAIPISRTLPEIEDLVFGLNRLGLVHIEWDQYDNAYQCHNEVLTKTAGSSDHFAEQRIAYSCLGDICRYRSQDNEAIVNYENSLRVDREKDPEFHSYLHHYLAALCNEINQQADAERHYKEWIKAAKETRNKATIIKACDEYCTYCIDNRKANEGIIYAKQMLEVATQIRSSYNQHEAHINLADFYQLLGNRSQVTFHQSKADELCPPNT